MVQRSLTQSFVHCYETGKSNGVAGADVAMASITNGLLKTEDAQKATAKAAEAIKNQQPLPRMTFSGK